MRVADSKPREIGAMTREMELRSLYFETLMKSLLGLLCEERPDQSAFLQRTPITSPFFERRLAEHGRDFPLLLSQAYTLVDRERMANVQECVEQAISDGVPGDLLEAGVWRGGVAIFMRAILKAYGILNRQVWVADSFEGLPAPEIHRFPADLPWIPWAGRLGVPLDAVKGNFERYGLLDEQVRFLKGWFKDTLPTAPVETLAVLRLDGDLYQSILDCLIHLYPRLSVGGFVIIDDFFLFKGCRQAVLDYRATHNINEPINEVAGNNAAYWRRH